MQPNQIHQLIISPSKHLQVLKSGGIKHYKTKSELSISSFSNKSEKIPVFFIIRDVFSKSIYAELLVTSDLSELPQFLFNAWSKKDTKTRMPFGIPNSVMVSERLTSILPHYFEVLSSLMINIHHPSDGFSSGVRIIRTLEDQIRSFFYKGTSTLSELNGMVETTVYSLNATPKGRELCPFQTWYEGIGEIVVPGDKMDFLNYFRKT